MNDNQPWTFTCNTCGNHGLIVIHAWSIRTGVDSEKWQEWGPLEASHRWHYDFKEKIEKADDDSDSEAEEYKIFKQESDLESDEFYVNCAACDREIEFGWSGIDRGGGIFPVECSDFVPGMYWPEPRYVKSWQQKGWLQNAGEK